MLGRYKLRVSGSGVHIICDNKVGLAWALSTLRQLLSHWTNMCAAAAASSPRNPSIISVFFVFDRHSVACCFIVTRVAHCLMFICVALLSAAGALLSSLINRDSAIVVSYSSAVSALS